MKYNIILILSSTVVLYLGDRILKQLGKVNKVSRNSLIKKEESNKANYIVRPFLSLVIVIEKAMQVVLFRGMIYYSKDI